MIHIIQLERPQHKRTDVVVQKRDPEGNEA